MPASLRTSRLNLLPLSFSQLELCLTNLRALETDLGFPVLSDIIDSNVQRAIGMKLEKMAVLDTSLHAWQTYWLIVLSGEKLGVGLGGFKGVPDAEGVTEIGYGIAPSHRNQGYMSEAVRALVGWALEQPSCQAVTASEVKNPASRRLLEKLGARLVADEEAYTSWEFRK